MYTIPHGGWIGTTYMQVIPQQTVLRLRLVLTLGDYTPHIPPYRLQYPFPIFDLRSWAGPLHVQLGGPGYSPLSFLPRPPRSEFPDP